MPLPAMLTDSALCIFCGCPVGRSGHRGKMKWNVQRPEWNRSWGRRCSCQLHRGDSTLYIFFPWKIINKSEVKRNLKQGLCTHDYHHRLSFISLLYIPTLRVTSYPGLSRTLPILPPMPIVLGILSVPANQHGWPPSGLFPRYCVI